MDKLYSVKFKYGNEVITSNEKENDFYRLEIENTGICNFYLPG